MTGLPFSPPKEVPTKYEQYLKYTSQVTAKTKPPTNTPKKFCYTTQHI